MHSLVRSQADVEIQREHQEEAEGLPAVNGLHSLAELFHLQLDVARVDGDE